MIRFCRVALVVALLACVSVLAAPLSAQPGPIAAQVQAGLRAFLTVAHTWTATQTFTNLVVNGSCTGCAAGAGNVTAGGTLTANTLIIGQGTTAVAATPTGTGVITALGVNVGSAGAVVVNGGALGTPSSGNLTNATTKSLTCQATVTLTDAQIKALPVTVANFEVVPAPGANLLILPQQGLITVDAAAGAYTNINANGYVVLQYANTRDASNFSYASDVFGVAAIQASWIGAPPAFWDDGFGGTFSSQTALTNAVNKALMLKADNFSDGAYLDGNAANSARVSVAYFVLNTATGQFVPCSL